MSGPPSRLIATGGVLVGAGVLIMWESELLETLLTDPLLVG